MFRPPLSKLLVESLFARLVVTWGKAFTTQYEGVDAAAVKADWADKLRGFQRSGTDGAPTAPAIDWALDNLPPKPLNAVEFRQLCARYTAPEAPALPGPRRPVPEKFRKAISRLAAPIEDTRPEYVRVAERYIAIHGNREKSTPLVVANLLDAQRTLADYERQVELEAQRAPYRAHVPAPTEAPHGN